MERFDEFSSIEQAATEQSPASETDVRHNFVGASSFLDDIVDGVGDIAENIGDQVVVAVENAANVGENVAAVAEGAADIVEAVAGGVIVDTVFTKQHVELLKSVDKECSVDELIDLRSSLIKANRK
jgi:hypothetical protein